MKTGGNCTVSHGIEHLHLPFTSHAHVCVVGAVCVCVCVRQATVGWLLVGAQCKQRSPKLLRQVHFRIRSRTTPLRCLTKFCCQNWKMLARQFLTGVATKGLTAQLPVPLSRCLPVALSDRGWPKKVFSCGNVLRQLPQILAELRAHLTFTANFATLNNT